MTLADVEHVLASLRLRYTRHGNRIRSQCPCHDDQEPSLIVDWRGGEIRVKCFAGCDPKRILQALHLGQNHVSYSEQGYVHDYNSKSCNVSHGLDILTLVCAEAFNRSNPLSEMELRRRGIAENRYGVIDANVLVRLLMRDDPIRLVRSGLAYYRFNDLRFPRAFASNRVVIPYWREGRVVSIRSRRIDEDSTPKYLSLRGYPSRAYVARAVKGTTLVVVEGEFKAMVLADNLPEMVSVIGLPGVHNAWKDLMELCGKYGFARRIVMFDTERNNDQVMKAAKKLALKIKGEVALLELLEGEERMAPDDFILKFGVEQLWRIILGN